MAVRIITNAIVPSNISNSPAPVLLDVNSMVLERVWVETCHSHSRGLLHVTQLGDLLHASPSFTKIDAPRRHLS